MVRFALLNDTLETPTARVGCRWAKRSAPTT